MSEIANDKVLGLLVQQLNSGLPRKRRLLSDLLKMPDPHYEGRDERRYVLDRRELELLREVVEDQGLRELEVPIVLMTDTSQEQSAWRVEDETECAVMMQILGRKMVRPTDRLVLYAAHLSVVRRKLPTTTVPMFIP